eukprot:scaffold5060_cov123-Isochrysis_galbana.AAC.2
MPQSAQRVTPPAGSGKRQAPARVGCGEGVDRPARQRVGPAVSLPGHVPKLYRRAAGLGERLRPAGRLALQRSCLARNHLAAHLSEQHLAVAIHGHRSHGSLPAVAGQPGCCSETEQQPFVLCGHRRGTRPLEVASALPGELAGVENDGAGTAACPGAAVQRSIEPHHQPSWEQARRSWEQPGCREGPHWRPHTGARTGVCFCTAGAVPRAPAR